MEKVLCWKCRCLRDYTIHTRKASHKIHGKKYKYEEKVATCNECGEEITVPGLDDENIRVLETVYKNSIGLRGCEVDWNVIQRLKCCFKGSFINGVGEFIAYQKANEYFILVTCETELDVKCKVLEWFSRGTFKTQRFDSDLENDEYHAFMLNGVNQFLGTEFTEDDMEVIYVYLGNACNHDKTIRFIESGYDMSVLKN